MMEYLLFIVYAVLISLVLYKSPFLREIPTAYKFSAAGLKIATALAGGFIYKQYLDGGDTHTFMQDANLIYHSLHESVSHYIQLVTGIEREPGLLQSYYSRMGTNSAAGYGQWFNNSLLFVRLNAFLCLFTGGYYSIHAMLFAFISFIGLTALYKTVADNTSFQPYVFILITFIPGVLFWSSMLLKEPLIIFLSGFSLYNFSNYLLTKNKINLGHSLLCFGLLLVIKSFVALSFLPGLIAWGIFAFHKKNWLRILSVTLLVFVIAICLLSLTGELFNFFYALHLQQIVFLKFAVYYQAKSLIDLIPFAPNAYSTLRHVPQALYIALVRPYPWEGGSILNHFAAADNILVLVLLIYGIYKADLNKFRTTPIFAVLILTGVTILILTAFTTPVLGALVRLKMPGVLFIIAGLAGMRKKPDSNKSFNLHL